MTKKTKTTKPTQSKTKSKKKKEKNFRDLLRNLFFENTNKAFSIKQIFRNLQVGDKTAKLKVVEELEALAESNAIKMTQDGSFKANQIGEIFEGVVDFVNPRFAFIICEGLEEDVWVNSDDLRFALDGDRVKVQVYKQSGGKRPEGEVLEILERRRDEFVGKIELSERYAFVIADNKKMHLDIFIPNKATNHAKNGDKVIVKIKEWHDEKNSPVGEVIEVLGKAGEHETEMHAIMAEFDLPLRFPPEVLEESDKIQSKVTKTEIAKRRDFRAITTFTIDPADAKDFDDALSIRKIKDNLWEIGVHIADVTHYVRPNTALEKEASRRATSVYLVDRVIPMLPEKLSNDLCSLRPHEDRLTFSAVFQIDEEGQVIAEWFGRTIIHSDRRFSYEEAQEVLESGQGDFHQELILLNELAKKLNEQRFRSGAINFDTPEVKFKLDEYGNPIGIYIKERKDAHKLIEEFMLLANKKVAEFVQKMQEDEKEKTMVYRIHEKPDEEKLQNFSVFAKKFGFDIAVKGKAVASSINHLVDRTTGTPQQSVLQSLAIRTMAKARYSTESIGHFGLAFAHYTHFTSPIRRYPDMMAHRLLQRYLDAKSSANKAEFEEKCRHSTDMEKRAADAERASIKYKQVEYMQRIENKDFDGVVTGVTEWGVYVEILETKCEGMVRMSDILDDFYELDADNYRIVGKKTQRVISFGDAVKVRVKDTNLEKRTMDLIFVA
ncbi:MAG: ribonuclease R [Microscillaceae bacterium]|nr:ribonuclease R [Microscillaceae bacterium]